MKKTELPNCPKWLLDARTENEDVEWDSHQQNFIEWLDGEWRGGVWRDGEWLGGVWRAGEWRGKENRLLYMASMLGIVFDENNEAVAYRSVFADGHGRHCSGFLQAEGLVEVEAEPAGKGTCVAGLHVTSAAIACTYFGVDPTARLVRVKFQREDLLDCDGQKARIRKGECKFVPWPFIGG